MPYEEHPSFPPPDDLDAKIWRYMDFTKLVSMLEMSSLWFSRADKLGDPFEASLLPTVPVNMRCPANRPSLQEATGPMRKVTIETAAVNCWHMNEHESAAMWRLYTQSSEGIAVRSTFKNLTESFIDCAPFLSVGLVRYIDYDHDRFGTEQMTVFDALLHKRKSYEHEREVRAVVWPPGGERHDISPIPDGGMAIRVDLKKLVDEAFVAPTAPSWARALTESVVRRYGLNVPVTQSRLLEDPLV